MKLKIKPIINHINILKFELIIIAVALFLDLFSKFLISKFMTLGQNVVLIDKFLSFYYVLNTKAAFSFDFGLTKLIGAKGVRIFFICLMSVVVLIFFVIMNLGTKNHKLFRISLAMIIGGALGNLYDRIFHHAVRDFISIEYLGLELFGSKSFAIFNIADSSLVIGTILFIIYFIFLFSKDEKRREKEKQSLQQINNEEAV